MIGTEYFWIFLAVVVSLCASTPVRLSPKHAKCIHNNETYSAGEKFQPEPCMFCKCPRHGGRVQCGIQDCQFTANCVRYERAENECCGRCVQHGCKHSDGRIYHPGAVISASQCERCWCPDDGGRTQCRTVPCPDLACVDPVHDEGHCCPRCPKGANCWLNGKVINADDIVLEQECRICHCYSGPRPAWLPKLAQPKAVCFVLTSKEKKGCPDESITLLADQAVESKQADTMAYVLHNDHAQRDILYREFVERHQRRKSMLKT